MSKDLIIYIFGFVMLIQSGTIAFLTVKIRRSTDKIRRYGTAQYYQAQYNKLNK